MLASRDSCWEPASGKCRRFHLMRQLVAIFSSHGVRDSHLMETRSIYVAVFAAPPFSRHAFTHRKIRREEKEKAEKKKEGGRLNYEVRMMTP